MEIDEELLRSFARSGLASYELAGLGVEHERALASLEEEFRDDYLELNEATAREERWRRCGVAGSRPEDFAESLVELGAGRAALCGIRHLGMNLEKPFVRVWPNFPVASAGEARELYAAFLRERYAVFSPICLQWFSASGRESEAAGALTLAGRASGCLERGPWTLEEDLRFEEPSDDGYLAWYERTYDRFHQDFPDLRDRVTCNDRELMEDCRANGLLRIARLGDRGVGIIAGQRERFLGHRGMYFVEIVIDREWRGRGLAKAMQRKFVAECCQAEDIVWGTIESRNQASVKTALANGRRVARGECFFYL